MMAASIMRTPVVGITTYATRACYGEWDLHAALIPWRYVSSVARADGRPLLIPPVRDSWQNTLDVLDGVILGGGPDIDPQIYGEVPHSETVDVNRWRDDVEIAIAMSALEQDIPVLGICRGAQVINIALGGTLHQHLPTIVGHSGHKGAHPGEFASHKVAV